jgi:hypothetical protein
LNIPENESAGFCGTVSVLLWQELGEPKDFKPCHVSMRNPGFHNHVFLFNVQTKQYIDPTFDQFHIFKKLSLDFSGYIDESVHFDIEECSKETISAIIYEHELNINWVHE